MHRSRWFASSRSQSGCWRCAPRPPRLRTRGSSGDSIRATLQSVSAVIDSARLQGLPIEPLVQRALEGAAKHAASRADRRGRSPSGRGARDGTAGARIRLLADGARRRGERAPGRREPGRSHSAAPPPHPIAHRRVGDARRPRRQRGTARFRFGRGDRPRRVGPRRPDRGLPPRGRAGHRARRPAGRRGGGPCRCRPATDARWRPEETVIRMTSGA